MVCTQHSSSRIRCILRVENRFLMCFQKSPMGMHRKKLRLYICKNRNSDPKLYFYPQYDAEEYYGGSCSVRHCCSTGKFTIWTIFWSTFCAFFWWFVYAVAGGLRPEQARFTHRAKQTMEATLSVRMRWPNKNCAHKILFVFSVTHWRVFKKKSALRWNFCLISF